MRAEEGKRERETEEKRKRDEKMGIKIVVFLCACVFFFIIFYYKSTCRCFFSSAQWSFFGYIKKTVSRLSRSYPLFFAIKISMVSQFGGPNMHPYPYFGNFFKYLWPS